MHGGGRLNMAITLADFTKIWASTSPLIPYSFSESNYKEGWNFIGATPPARQMWDSIQKTNDEKAKFLLELAQMIVPVGVVQAFAGTTTPQGWLLCDGSAVSRTDYADLYAVIGDTYGAGDGSTTFNLPNLVDKFVEGSATSGTVKSAGLPNITGTANFRKFNTGDPMFYPNGVFATEDISSALSTPSSSGSTKPAQQLKFNASSSNSIYGNSTTVQPPALTMQYIIKY